MATTADMRSGLIIKVDGSLYSVIEFGQNKTARAAAKVWAKLKGVDNSRTIEMTWNSGETIFPVRVEKKPYQFLYKDDTGYNFMDTENFEQIELSQDALGDSYKYLTPDIVIGVTFYETTPLSVNLPQTMEFKVVEADPEIKGATASASFKNATLDIGVILQVPQFVKVGDVVKINTETGEYLERAKK